MSQFKREQRYVVIKLSKLTDIQRGVLFSNLSSAAISLDASPECVVVESDWPNYEETWDSVQAVAEGTYVPRSQLQAERDALAAQVAYLNELVKVEAHAAYYEASDNNRSDRWSDTFDDDIKKEFEKYWATNNLDSKLIEAAKRQEGE